MLLKHVYDQSEHFLKYSLRFTGSAIKILVTCLQHKGGGSNISSEM